VVEFTFDDQPMISAFIKFLNAVKHKGDIPSALRNLHSKIAEKSVSYRTPVYIVILFVVVISLDINDLVVLINKIVKKC